MMESTGIDWLHLMQQPYDDVFGIKNIWDLRTPDGRAVRIERCGQGLNNRLFRVRFNGDVFSCKLFLDDERRRHHREWMAISVLDQAGEDLAPHPLFYAPTGPLPHPTIVCRWVAGTPLAGAPLSQEATSALVAAMNRIHLVDVPDEAEMLRAWHHLTSYAEYSAGVADEVLRIRTWVADVSKHSVSLPGFAADLPAQLGLIEAASQIAQDVVRSAAGEGDAMPRALVRADGDLESIIRDDLGHIRFSDWDHSGIGDPALDIAELRWHPRSLATEPQYWQEAIAGYLPRAGDATFAERLRVYDRLVPAAWIARSASLLVEGVNRFNAKRRIAAAPIRMYRTVNSQLQHYFVALGLLSPDLADASDAH